MKNQKKRIEVAIVQFMDMLQPGDQIRSEEIVKAVKRSLGIKYLYEDTPLRYLRNLRKQGRVNYRCLSKSKRIFEVI
jgi:hypothetical protein